MTYDMVAKFNKMLTDEQISRLLIEAAKIIRPIIPTANIVFQYDHVSS